MARAAPSPFTHALPTHICAAQTTGKTHGPIAKDSGIRPLEFFMCSVAKETGYQDALKWLTNYVEDQSAGSGGGGQ